MPYLFDLPTVAAVLSAARLRAEQFDPTLSQVEFEAEAQTRIELMADVVEAELLSASAPHVWPFTDATLATAYPEYSSEARTRFTQRQKSNAAEVVRLWAAAALVREAKQFNEAYEKRADALEAHGRQVLEVLEKTCEFVSEAAQSPGSAGGSAAQSITPCRVDEYHCRPLTVPSYGDECFDLDCDYCDD